MPIPGTKTVETVKNFLEGREGKGGSISARTTDAGLTLFSYDEPIALLDDRMKTVYAELDWKYSRTTTRHRALLSSAAAASGHEVQRLSREEIRARTGLDPHAPPPRLY